VVPKEHSGNSVPFRDGALAAEKLRNFFSQLGRELGRGELAGGGWGDS